MSNSRTRGFLFPLSYAFRKRVFNIAILKLEPVSNERPGIFIQHRGIHEFLNLSIFVKKTISFNSMLQLPFHRKFFEMATTASKPLFFLKACYFMKVGLVDLSPYGRKIKFEFWLSRQRRAGRQNSNIIFPPSVLKSTRPTFIK